MTFIHCKVVALMAMLLQRHQERCSFLIVVPTSIIEQWKREVTITPAWQKDWLFKNMPLRHDICYLSSCIFHVDSKVGAEDWLGRLPRQCESLSLAFLVLMLIHALAWCGMMSRLKTVQTFETKCRTTLSECVYDTNNMSSWWLGKKLNFKCPCLSQAMVTTYTLFERSSTSSDRNFLVGVMGHLSI